MPYWVVIPISNNSITPTGAQCDQDFCGVLPRSDPRPAGLVLVWTRTTHFRSEKTQILHEVACTPAPPKTSFGCRKGGCVSAWVDALLVPTNMRAFRVGLGGIRAPMHDVGRRAWCVRPFELFLPRRGPCLERARSFFLRMRVASPTYRACPAKIGEFMRHLVRVIGRRVCCSPCAHHLACKKSNNAEA